MGGVGSSSFVVVVVVVVVVCLFAFCTRQFKLLGTVPQQTLLALLRETPGPYKHAGVADAQVYLH